jgi:hypothetical protein
MNPTARESLAASLLDSLVHMDEPLPGPPSPRLLKEFLQALEQARALQQHDLERANDRLELLSFAALLLDQSDWQEWLGAASLLHSEAATEYLNTVSKSVADLMAAHAKAVEDATAQLKEEMVGRYVITRVRPGVAGWEEHREAYVIGVWVDPAVHPSRGDGGSLDLIWSHRPLDAPYHPRALIGRAHIQYVGLPQAQPRWVRQRLDADSPEHSRQHQLLLEGGWSYRQDDGVHHYEAPDGYTTHCLWCAFAHFKDNEAGLVNHDCLDRP